MHSRIGFSDTKKNHLKKGARSGMKEEDAGANISHLVVVVLMVRILTLQLDHLQPGDPLLLFGRHEITVRIPILCFSTEVILFL